MEEDIKIMEARVTTLKRHIKYYEESDCKTNVYQCLVLERKALENLIKRYKELEEELNSVKEIYYTQKEVETNYIPISVIQKKIDELKAMNLECDTFGSMRNYAVLILQEILGERGR